MDLTLSLILIPLSEKAIDLTGINKGEFCRSTDVFEITSLSRKSSPQSSILALGFAVIPRISFDG